MSPLLEDIPREGNHFPFFSPSYSQCWSERRTSFLEAWQGKAPEHAHAWRPGTAWGILGDARYLLRLQNGVTFAEPWNNNPSKLFWAGTPVFTLLGNPVLQAALSTGCHPPCVYPAPQLPPSCQSGRNTNSSVVTDSQLKPTHTCRKQRPPQANSKRKTILQNISFWTAFDLHSGKPWGEIPIMNGLNLSKHLLDW